METYLISYFYLNKSDLSESLAGNNEISVPCPPPHSPGLPAAVSLDPGVSELVPMARDFSEVVLMVPCASEGGADDLRSYFFMISIVLEIVFMATRVPRVVFVVSMCLILPSGF